ncbi:hypothetical protein E1301_Tti020274 [Triplophysa tibetana]|uniref:Uncharacterized protein n=1 Tax=Triplophysa tibetana TaxID=1572043 RepID=A0A5A9N2Z6_9TELE|nr:hypothetical protein E1301_Tti020274 [Triplophysa tibetana]
MTALLRRDTSAGTCGRAIAHEYNSGFNPLQLHCWCYDVLQRIVPSCSDLPLGVSAVPESTTSGLRPRGLPVLAALSDMGNSANVNPPAKCSRADRTPIRSSERSPTGGGIPSGSSATHSETMCDIDEMSLAASEGDWHPTLTNPSSTHSGRVQDEAEVMSSVLTRGYVVPEAAPRKRKSRGKPPPRQQPSREKGHFPGVLAADRTLHWTVPGKPDLTPWRGVGSYTHDSCYHSQTNRLASGGAYPCESTFPPSNRLGQCAIYLFFLPKHMAKKLVPHLPPFLPRHWLRIGIPSITKQAPPGGWLGRAAFPLRPGYHVDLHLAVNYSVRTFHAFSSKDETIPISTIFLPTGRRWPLQRIPD